MNPSAPSQPRGSRHRGYLTFVLLVLAALASGAAFADNVSGTQAYGDTTRAYRYSNGTPVLSEFWFFFQNGDHHLKKIKIRTEGGWNPNEVFLDFRDKNADDPYQYEVGHHNIYKSSATTGAVSGYCTGVCTLYLSDRPSSQHVFVLQGFEFNYTSSDHHMNRIGVFEENRYLTLHFNDKNSDDRFYYVINYAWLEPDAVDSEGTFSGTRANGSVTESGWQSSYRAMAGFYLDFESDCTSGGDHHVEEIGVRREHGAYNQYKLLYNDDNDDDCFDYEYQWVKLDGDHVIYNLF